MSNVTIMMVGFLVFTTFVLFFGTAMAHLAWRVFEKDSDRVIQRSRENKPALSASSKTQAKDHIARQPTPQPAASGRNNLRTYVNKKQTVPTSSSHV